MLILPSTDIRPSEITPRRVFDGRRNFIKQVGAGVAAGVMAPWLAEPALGAARLPGLVSSPYSVRNETQTPYKDVTTYNNYYEFGYDKDAPAHHAHTLKTQPWTLVVDGLCKKPTRFSMEDIRKIAPLEERIYRLRCVEAWSMVIPWAGFPLAQLLKRVEPLGSAKYVGFQTLLDKAAMPGVFLPYLHWPYTEGLRLDEAMHPLTLLALGLYGEELPNQNGAPVRLVVPWKYGFKSAKSIVRITLTEQQPATAWNVQQASEYGFYANVNPSVDHPRWSQARERRIGEFLKRPTLMFNGYADQVASLYAGMDLRRYF